MKDLVLRARQSVPFAVIHWASFAFYLYIMVPAAIRKVVHEPAMIKNMAGMGFDKIPTTIIGWVEVIGSMAMLTGILKSSIKNAALLFLFPVAVGAMSSQLVMREYVHIYGSFYCCSLTIVMLITDKKFKIEL